MAVTERTLRELFALNVLLQLFDGFVTYQALQLGFDEGNPILRAAFVTLGTGPTLVLFKAKACGFLLLLRRTAPPAISAPAMRFVAIVYALGSLGPWLGSLLAVPFLD